MNRKESLKNRDRKADGMVKPLRLFSRLFLVLLLLCGCAPESANEDAERYRNGKCVVFYPPGNEEIKGYAEHLCESGEELVFDYVRERRGDLFIMSYGDGKEFYINEDNSKLELKVRSGAGLLSRMLRYEMKKDGLDRAYTSSFWIDTMKENIDLSHVSLELGEDDFTLYCKDFDYRLTLPMGYLKAFTGKNAGVTDITTYEHDNYIDPNRPMVAITYDDGPYDRVDSILYDTFSYYGGKATFYSVGSRMSKAELENIRRGIELGMEFGSHTEYHDDLGEQTIENAKWAVLEPVNYVYEKLGYRMKTYRPPYGSRNYEMEYSLGMPAILWSVDSRDWSNRDADITYSRIIDNVSDGDIVLMHSLYMSSAEATQKLVPKLMDMGYQLVTVSELMEYRGIDADKIRAYGGR